MKIKLVSDLHLEFSDINIKNDEGCDVLILGGDIMVAQDLHDHPEPANTADQMAIANGTGLGRRQQSAQRFRDFLKRCSFSFPHVIYIAGNHEFYHGKWHQTLQILAEECAKHPNIYFLENGYKKIDDVIFVGGTLWTDMNKADPITLHSARNSMNDFRIIRKEFEGYTTVKPADTVYRHRDTLRYIEEIVDRKEVDKYVVVGHHSPSYQSVHDMYKSEYHMNGCYHSDLSNTILDRPQIKLWTHGHTHHPFDYMIGETRIVCNPRGYENDGYSEDTGWNPNIVLEI